MSAPSGPEKVLVVGAGGFVGAAVLQALTGSAAYRPVAGMRRRPEVRADSIEQRRCDATDGRSLDAALAGVSAAVCCVLGSGASMLRATTLLCEAVAAGKLRRLVLISSMSVYGAAEGLVDETARLAGAECGAYGAAKQACEELAGSFMARGLPICILRPGIVYGPGGDQWIGRIGRLLRAGRIGDLGIGGDGICNLVHKDDLAAAVVAALATPAAAGQAFNLADGDDGTWNEFITDFGCMIGVAHVPRLSSRRMRMETGLLAPPLQILKLAGFRRGRPWADPIPPSLLALWGQRIRLDPRRAETVLGTSWTARARGLAMSAEWFMAQELRHRSYKSVGHEVSA